MRVRMCVCVYPYECLSLCVCVCACVRYSSRQWTVPPALDRTGCRASLLASLRPQRTPVSTCCVTFCQRSQTSPSFMHLVHGVAPQRVPRVSSPRPIQTQRPRRDIHLPPLTVAVETVKQGIGPTQGTVDV